MNKTKKRRKTQQSRRRKTQQSRRKQMRGGLEYIGQYTDGVIGTFEFEAIDVNDLYYNRKFYEDNINQFKCSFLDIGDIAVIIDSYLNTKDYALDTGTYGYKGGTQENKVFLLYFIEPSGLPFVPHTKTMIGFISCSIYRPRNICYVRWECSYASVIKDLVTIGDRRVEKASHVLQAFFINYLGDMGITTIYKQLRTYDHPYNEHGDTRIPHYMIAKYNLATAFKLFTKRQLDDEADLTFLQLRNDHYSKFDISQFNRVYPTLTGQISEYPNEENLDDLIEMLRAAKRYETEEVSNEIAGYIDTLKSSYSHDERLKYMRNLCYTLNMNNTLSMNLFSIGKPKPKTKENEKTAPDTIVSPKTIKQGLDPKTSLAKLRKTANTARDTRRIAASHNRRTLDTQDPLPPIGTSQQTPHGP